MNISILKFKKEQNNNIKNINKILIEYFSTKEKFFILKIFSKIFSFNLNLNKIKQNVIKYMVFKISVI